MRPSFTTTRNRILEALLVLALVMLFFLALLALLNTMFPTGQSLLGLIRPGGSGDSLMVDRSASRKLRVSTGSGGSGFGEMDGITAVLMSLDNQVKSKRADQIAWGGATEGMIFNNKDAVQTFGKSTATLSFTKGNFLELGENSLVVIREMEGDVFTREHRTVVVLMGGELSGRVSKAGSVKHNLEVVAPGAVARAPSRSTDDRPSRFQMTVNPDNTSVLTVLEGTADLVVEGKTIRVGTDQVVKVVPGQPVIFLHPPPGPPALAFPENGRTFDFGSVSPKVSFGWDGASNVSNYHFILAGDPQFQEIIHEDTVDDNRFVHGNLKQGDYYWRVSSVNQDGEGRFSRVRHFRLAQDLDPPALVVDYPESAEAGDRFELKGRTDPDARVFVGGMPVATDEDGKFTHDLFLKRGYNVIVVEAVDNVGNVAYFSKVINVEF